MNEWFINTNKVEKIRLETYKEEIKRSKFPLTEDILTLVLLDYLRQQESRVFARVSHNAGSKNSKIKGWGFWFAPDIDLLEVREDNTVIGYELKGVVKHKSKRKGKESETKKDYYYLPPAPYEGIGQAIAYLDNPTIFSPYENNVEVVTEEKFGKQTFSGGIFDYVYLVHPYLPEIDYSKTIRYVEYTPLGLILIDYEGAREKVSPKQNPYLNNKIKKLFLDDLSILSKFTFVKLKKPSFY